MEPEGLGRRRRLHSDGGGRLGALRDQGSCYWAGYRFGGREPGELGAWARSGRVEELGFGRRRPGSGEVRKLGGTGLGPERQSRGVRGCM